MIRGCKRLYDDLIQTNDDSLIKRKMCYYGFELNGEGGLWMLTAKACMKVTYYDR